MLLAPPSYLVWSLPLRPRLAQLALHQPAALPRACAQTCLALSLSPASLVIAPLPSGPSFDLDSHWPIVNGPKLSRCNIVHLRSLPCQALATSPRHHHCNHLTRRSIFSHPPRPPLHPLLTPHLLNRIHARILAYTHHSHLLFLYISAHLQNTLYNTITGQWRALIAQRLRFLWNLVFLTQLKRRCF